MRALMINVSRTSKRCTTLFAVKQCNGLSGVQVFRYREDGVKLLEWSVVASADRIRKIGRTIAILLAEEEEEEEEEEEDTNRSVYIYFRVEQRNSKVIKRFTTLPPRVGRLFRYFNMLLLHATSTEPSGSMG